MAYSFPYLSLVTDLVGVVCKVNHSSMADARQPTAELPSRTGRGRWHRSILMPDSFFRRWSILIYQGVG